MSFEEVLAHSGPMEAAMPEEVWRSVRARMPSYIWIDTFEDDYGETVREVHCERCDNGWIERKKGGRWPEGRGQGKECRCPQCGERVIAKHTSVNTYIRDEIDVTWFAKSRKDPDTVVAFAANCVRCAHSYGGEPWEQGMNVNLRGIAVIPYSGEFSRWRSKELYEPYAGGWRQTGYVFKRVKKIGNLRTVSACGIGMRSPEHIIFQETLEAAIAGTPFARAWRPAYDLCGKGKDGVEALALIAKWPCVEYLGKLGYEAFFRARLMGELPTGAVNWHGRTAEKVLRTPKQRLGEMKAAGIAYTPHMQQVWQFADGQGIRINARTCRGMASLLQGYSACDIKWRLEAALAPHQPNRRAKAMKYMVRETNFNEARDYWAQCAQLPDCDLNDDMIAFPKNLHEAHERMDCRVKLLGNKAYDEQIKKNLKRWQRKFGFKFGGLELRPARDSTEVIREGEVLRHCVARYVRSYAKGETVICVLRRTVDPDRPWRTVEITPDGRMVQDRGWKNDLGGTEIGEKYRLALDMFWQAWQERRQTA